MARLPTFGDRTYKNRVCNVIVDGTRANPILCGNPAFNHVLWTPQRPSSFLCRDHDREILSKYGYHQEHLMGPYCGMPEATWNIETNECELPEELMISTEVKEDLEALV